MARLLYWMLLLLLTAFAANEARLGRYEEASGVAILAGLLAVLGPLYAYVLEPWNQRVSRDRLVEWIGENARDIRHGGAMREGVRVVPGTRLVRFEIVFSMVYFSRRTTTNLYLAGTPRAFFVRVAATAFTAIFGW